MKKLNLLGAGKVGQTLFRLLAECHGYEIQDIAASTVESARNAVAFIGKGHAVACLADMRAADIWFLTVPDRAIGDMADQLAAHPSVGGGNEPIFVHCSGSLPSSVMAPLGERGGALASLHPVLSFASPQESCRQFAGTWCGLEGDATAKSALKPLISAIGGNAFEIETQRKMLYHAAAVFSNNFTVVLQAIAQSAWSKAGLTDDAIQQINRTLLASTIDNVVAVGPARALTGPAARGDRIIVETQARLVEEWFGDAASIYRQMSELAQRLKEQGTLP